MHSSYRSSTGFTFLKSLSHASLFTNSSNLKQVPHAFTMANKRLREKQRLIMSNITVANQHELLSDMVTPYWRLSYEEELEIKQKMCEDVMNEFFIKTSSNKKIHNIVESIVASPVRDAYRHRDEFSVWPGLDGDPKTVGFFVGSPAVGKVVCVPATHIKCTKESHKQIAELYQSYIRSSPLPVSYQLYDGGFWRNIVVRSNDQGDHMAIVISNPNTFPTEQIKEQEQLLAEFFSQNTPCLSLFHQSCQHVKCTREQAPFHHLRGQPYLTEVLCNRTFRISPDSFFQSNKAAAKLMFNAVLQMARLKPYTTLLDLYCGTGAISILASEQVRGCLGVEELQAAVDDAKHNAQSNNIDNCTFIKGRVEMKLKSILNSLDCSSDIVAVLNPGRDGASEGVVSLLRQSSNVRSVIYISCKPNHPRTLKNFVQLCERIAVDSKPFSLSRVLPVDLFPYTNNIELILRFDKR